MSRADATAVVVTVYEFPNDGAFAQSPTECRALRVPAPPHPRGPVARGVESRATGGPTRALESVSAHWASRLAEQDYGPFCRLGTTAGDVGAMTETASMPASPVFVAVHDRSEGRIIVA